MNFRGRHLDPISVWERYVEFPTSTKPDETFSPLVQCPNPAHDTLKRHFQVNFSEPMVHCFAHCGISGSWEHAICVIEGLYEKFKVEDAPNEREHKRRKDRAYRYARRIIIRDARPSKFHKKPGVRKKHGATGATATIPSDVLAYERFLPAVALNYLLERGIRDNATAKWELGWDLEEARLVIPARDLRGKLRFLIKRSLKGGGSFKYLYTQGFPKTSLLFGACYIDLGLVHSSGLILVEGSLDTIRFHQHGLTNTVGILGTGISDEQVRIIEKLRPKRITLAFDKDGSGIRNIEIAQKKLRKYPLYVMKYPKGKSDPAELTRREALNQISKAQPLVLFNRKARTSTRRKEIHGTHTL
jgi:5S rRNA maturation endonuclease (ribonuclease M5)